MSSPPAAPGLGLFRFENASIQYDEKIRTLKDRTLTWSRRSAKDLGVISGIKELIYLVVPPKEGSHSLLGIRDIRGRVCREPVAREAFGREGANAGGER